MADRGGAEVRRVLAWLARRGSRRNRDGMARYGIVSPKVFGVSLAAMRGLARRLGRNHRLALELWATGWHEARILSALIDEPPRVTPRQMDRWAREFDNWAVCDSVCLHLFVRTPYAWQKVGQWTTRRETFVRRAGFALLACLAVHDRQTSDARFRAWLARIEACAHDDRPIVKKAVNWALRGIGKRGPALRRSAVATARRLAASSDRSARWVGADALRELTRRPAAEA